MRKAVITVDLGGQSILQDGEGRKVAISRDRRPYGKRCHRVFLFECL